ncbi:hypothetical protein GCM10009780_55300 [Actinomadura alba]
MLLTGCAGGGSNSSSGVSNAAGSAADAKREGTAPKAMEPGAPGSAPQQIKLSAPAARAVVYTASMEVETSDVEAAVTRAKALVTQAGGHVANENATTDPVGASITFKIPAERYGTVLDGLSHRLGTRRALRQEAEDVTEAVADVESRVRSAEAALKSFRKLLDRAGTVAEVINVEREISQRQADLEALQAKRRALAEQTGFATVTVRIEPTPKAAARPGGGFTGGLRSGWAAFVGALSALAVALGWLLPFLGALALIGVPVWRLSRLRRWPRRPRTETRDLSDREPAGQDPR